MEMKLSGMKQHYRSICEIVKSLGLKAEVSRNRQSHIVVTLEGKDGSFDVITSSTPSDHRAILNFKSRLRRKAVEVGCEMVES